MATSPDKNHETFQHNGNSNGKAGETTAQIRKKRRSLAKGRFHRVHRKFKQSVHEEEPLSILNDLLVDLEKSYLEAEAKTDDYLEILDDDADSGKMKDLQDDMEILYRELYDMKSLMSRKQVEHVGTSTNSDSSSKSASSGPPTLKVKRLDAPEFSGNIRDYPSFKRDYEHHMVTAYGEDPFALKKCLSGEALRTVKGVDDNYVEMFRRLDLKYGRPEKQADAVLSEIRQLKQIHEGNDRAFVDTVDIIEHCYLDLRKMNLESEMNTATMVSEIEKLLPRIQRREWAIKKQRESSRKNTFEIFLEFLLEEKHAIEYMENDLRNMEKFQKGKIHIASADSESTHDNSTGYSVLQDRLDRQEAMLQQVLAEISKPGLTMA